MTINNTGIFCCYFSTSFCSANPNFGLRLKLGVRLVFGLSEKTERKTNPKSEVIHCSMHEDHEQRSYDIHLRAWDDDQYWYITSDIDRPQITIGVQRAVT